MNTIVPLSAENAAYAVRLAEELHSMGSLKGIPFDQQYMLSNALKMLNDPSWHCYLAVDKNNYFCGIVTGYLTPFLFSPKLMAVESCWYVQENTPNRTKLGLMLMNNFIQWAKDNKAVKVQTGDIAGINSLAIDTIYRHIGFKRVGTAYMLECE